MFLQTIPAGQTEIGQIALHGVLIGIVSMAILQMAKDFLFSRSLFQSWQVRKWLARRAKLIIQTPPFGINSKQAEQELTLLATGGDKSALYRLPVEQLCGQVIAAAQAAMDSPRLYVNLLACLGGTSVVEYQRRETVLQYFPESGGTSTIRRLDLDWVFNPPVEDLRAAQMHMSGPEPNQGWNQDNLDLYKAARNRVSQRIQRSVDGLQIYLGSWWKLSMQLGALMLSFVIATGIGPYLSQGPGGSWGFKIAAAFVGGFLAPVFRDVLSVLGKLASRT